jgi:hypothetical protein
LIPKKRILTSSAKSKGRKLQQFVAQELCRMLSIPWNQQDDLCPIHSREMGQSGVDIVIRDRNVLKKIPYSFECKRTEQFSLTTTIQQASQNKYDGTDWVVVHQKNGWASPVVVISWPLFYELISIRAEHLT